MTFIAVLPQYLLEYHLKKNKFNLPVHFIVTCSILNDFLKLIMDETTLPIIWKNGNGILKGVGKDSKIQILC